MLYAAINGRSSTVAPRRADRNNYRCDAEPFTRTGEDARASTRLTQIARPINRPRRNTDGVRYPAAIIGTATNVATMPTVFQRVKRSPKKRRASNTVSAG
jgi:hypothetical protein